MLCYHGTKDEIRVGDVVTIDPACGETVPGHEVEVTEIREPDDNEDRPTIWVSGDKRVGGMVCSRFPFVQLVRRKDEPPKDDSPNVCVLAEGIVNYRDYVAACNRADAAEFALRDKSDECLRLLGEVAGCKVTQEDVRALQTQAKNLGEENERLVDHGRKEREELQRVRKDLDAAKSQIAKLEGELGHSKNHARSLQQILEESWNSQEEERKLTLRLVGSVCDLSAALAKATAS